MTTRVRTEFDRRVEVKAHVWIPMPDGCRLSARIWLPDDALENPVPAVMEYVPYRKDDDLALRDAPIHGYFAGNGYASVRVDIRGSGDSDGILEDEYLPLEQTDGVAVIRWLASQPWCTGKVGIIGKSWGGFNGLQIAALAPEELGAVISVASTDDRYADDVHYMGGCLLASNMLQWASVMLAYNARPPDPTVVGDSWREIWLDRMERTPPYLEEWVAHQRRDEFWKQGSVCEDFDAIKCPVYMVGGWTDAYRNAILRFLEGYHGPSKGLIGPWAHVYPESGAPGPAIGFLQEAVRWWDCHLKGIENGIMDEPKLRVYMADSVRPDPGRSFWPGRWLATDSWPSPEVSVRSRPLSGTATLGTPLGAAGAGGSGGSGTGSDQPGGAVDNAQVELVIKGADVPAADAGTWGGHGGPVDNPANQRPDDGQSLCFDTEPLAEPLEILGFPVAHLEVASDQPLALVVARLCDVWPDGTSHLVTRGLLNLTHRKSDEEPEALEVGKRYLVDVQLNSIGYSVPAGHRLRLAVSPTYWPWAWPSPAPVTLSLFTGGTSRLDLPVWTGRPGAHEPPPHFSEPEEAPSPPHEVSGAEDASRTFFRDVATGRLDIELRGEHHIKLFDAGLEYHSAAHNLHRIFEGDPLSAFNSGEHEISISRGEWATRVHTYSTMSATADDFLLTNLVEGFEGERRIFAKTWRRAIPRDMV